MLCCAVGDVRERSVTPLFQSAKSVLSLAMDLHFTDQKINEQRGGIKFGSVTLTELCH